MDWAAPPPWNIHKGMVDLKPYVINRYSYKS